MRPGCELKAVIPGGLSAPILTPEEIDLPMDFDSLAGAGSMLGSAAVMVIDREMPMLEVLRITARFYAHESCGQCTPCRIGTAWIDKIVTRMSEGRGQADDIDTIASLAANIKGKTECPLGDAAALPILSICAKFRRELEQSLR